MITRLADAKKAIFNPDNKLAFILGNGINRYAYGKTLDSSWNNLLLNAWRVNTPLTVSRIDEGVTFTEFYNLLEFVAPATKILDSIMNQVESWPVVKYHEQLLMKLQQVGSPVLTTNFDSNLENGLKKVIVPSRTGERSFTDYYPWNVVYTDNPKFDASKIYNFGIWHINGTVDYARSLRLSLSQYMLQTKRAVDFLHSSKSYDDNFVGKNKNYWKGHNTWLHLIFNCDLCILGLGLDTQETFLRWLLIERAKYFKMFPNRMRHGWYICKSKELTEGKKFFLEKTGFEIVELKSFEQIYCNLLDI